MLEALVLRKFIISSNCQTGPSEILLNGNGGLLFKVKDYKALSKKILFFSRNKRKCRSLLKNSVSSLSRFDSRINLKKYTDLFLKL